MARSRLIFPPLNFAANALPFTFIASGLVKGGEFRADVLGIVGMPEEQFSALSAALAGFPSFLDKAAIESIVAQVTGSSSTKTAALIYRLNQLLRSSSDPVEVAVRVLIEELSKYKEFPEQVIAVLRERLKALFLTPRGFDLQKKAEMLAEATGAELADFSIICDVRPVFDNERKKIEGAVALTTLRLELYQSDGSRLPVECRLTEPQLERLAKIVDTARGKLAVIQQLLETKDLRLANTVSVIEDTP
jgi:hypothetical protein